MAVGTPTKLDDAKAQRGRPSKYKPEYCQQLITHMSQGYSFESFAGDVEVTLSTLYEWENVHPDFSEAKNIAFQKCRKFWEKLGIDHVLNINESSSNADGDRSSISKSLNSGVWVYNMKCRFRDQWLEKKEVELKVTNNPDQAREELERLKQMIKEEESR